MQVICGCLAGLLVLLLWLIPPPVQAQSPSPAPELVEAVRRSYGLERTPGRMNLGTLLAAQRLHYPGAAVSGGFYDWRAVSRYRSHAGLHLGYDIALPAGTPVTCPWPGVVASVLPWVEGEYGVTISTPGGYQITFGHLVPSVSPGERLAAGAILGRVARDHVDIKMRDAAGRYIDYGSGGPAATTFPGGREQVAAAWLVARSGLEALEEEEARARRELRRLLAERRSLQRRLPELEEASEKLQDLALRGLVARKTAEETRQELEEARARRALLPSLITAARQSLDSLEPQVRGARAHLRAVTGEARSRGVTWRDVEELVALFLARHPELQRRQHAYEEARMARLQELRRRVEEGRRRLDQLERLYEMGGLARVDLEAARARQAALEEELAEATAVPGIGGE